MDRDQVIEAVWPFMGEGSIPERLRDGFARECADKVMALRDTELERLRARVAELERQLRAGPEAA